jgi:hypothetical protein
MIIASAQKRANTARECAEPPIMAHKAPMIADPVQSASPGSQHAHRIADQGEMVVK